ncbi:hypothetical protein QYF36_015254 [Acer negundo]|nr:hypothetical protein QYF36_015254 [Acer negundo]
MEGAMERVLECLRQEMKGARKSAMRVLKQEMELAMEPVIERVKNDGTTDKTKHHLIIRLRNQQKENKLPDKIYTNEQINNDSVTEAISQAFAVRDHRGKMNKKHDHPSLDDEVDFKNMYKTNPIKLREILNDCTESDWEEIVQHASSVVDDEKLNASSKPLISPTTVPHQGGFCVFCCRAVLDIMAGNSVSVEEMASIMEPIIQKLILVLDGDFGFGFEDQENWTEQDLNAKVVHETEGKRPLVTGKLDITLRDGIGIISDISFTDKMSKVQIRCKSCSKH